MLTLFSCWARRHIDSAKVIFDDSLTVLGYRLTRNFIECNKPLHGYKDFDMLKTIVQKWEDQQENVRDPRVDPRVPLNFTWFVDGDDQNFVAGNCVEVTPYEWFSAANGRNWCVSWDAALTDEEKAFVMDNFDLFAEHFEPRAARATQRYVHVMVVQLCLLTETSSFHNCPYSTGSDTLRGCLDTSAL
eukprot:COSAG02_NODE_1175_length_14063_cov_24.197794_10_plen_188_part_00